jgi:hypothetical protein
MDGFGMTILIHPVKLITTGEGGAVLTNDGLRETLDVETMASRRENLLAKDEGPWPMKCRPCFIPVTDFQ